MSQLFSHSIDFSNFIDRKAVTGRVPPMERRVLARAGGLVRTTARRSIRKRRRVSSPGSPPSSHSGELRRLIFFAYDRDASEVVIGPLLFRGASPNSAGGKTTPQLLEEGGTRSVPTRRRESRFGGQYTSPAKSQQYAPRPFMRPALDINIEKILDSFRGAL